MARSVSTGQPNSGNRLIAWSIPIVLGYGIEHFIWTRQIWISTWSKWWPMAVVLGVFVLFVCGAMFHGYQKILSSHMTKTVPNVIKAGWDTFQGSWRPWILLLLIGFGCSIGLRKLLEHESGWPEWWPIWLALSVLALSIGISVYYGYRRPLSGLGRWSGIPKRKKDPEFEAARTLWDWLNLIGVPITITLVGAIYSFSTRGSDLEIAERHRESDREIADDRLIAEALKGYFDSVGGLLSSRNFDDGCPPVAWGHLARAYTMHVLDEIDADGRRSVLEFLYHCGLIKPGVCPGNESIIDLSGANLTGIVFDEGIGLKSDTHTNLAGIDLSGAHLEGSHIQWPTDMSDAVLVETNLRNCDCHYGLFSGANFTRASMEGAVLLGADLTGANLQDATLGSPMGRRASLNEADLTGANLAGVSLLFVDLSGANLKDVKGLTQAALDETETYAYARNLPSYLHQDPRPWTRWINLPNPRTRR